MLVSFLNHLYGRQKFLFGTQKARWTETDEERQGSGEAERAKRRKNKMPLAKNSREREKKWLEKNKTEDE